MPTYKNISDYTIRIDGKDIVPNEQFEINRYISSSNFLLISNEPLVTSISIQSVLNEYQFQNKPNFPFHCAAAAEMLPGVMTFKKFGYNPSVGTSSETIWDKSGLYVYPSEAATMYVASNNANDTADGGTGARTVTISGLNGDYEYVEHLVSLDGLTPVEIGTMIRVFRMATTTSGSLIGTAGTLSVSDGTFTDGVPDGETYAQVLDGNNQTLMATFTVPAGYTGFVGESFINSGKSGEVIADSVGRAFGTSQFNISRRILLYEDSFVFNNTIPYVVPEKADIEIRAKVIATAVPVAAGFDLILVRN